MKKIEFLPLGSVVVLEGGSQRVIIVGRGLNVNDQGETFFFDYAGVPYPNGMVGDRIAYFDHDAIARVFFTGYSDDEDKIIVDRMNEYIAENPDLKRRRV